MEIIKCFIDFANKKGLMQKLEGGVFYKALSSTLLIIAAIGASGLGLATK